MTVERALIGTNVCGVPIVLATDGGTVFFMCKEVSTGCEDIGLCDAALAPGLYLWEGEARTEVYGAPWDTQEPELVFDGTIRPVRLEEVAELYAMLPPPEICPLCHKPTAREDGGIHDACINEQAAADAVGDQSADLAEGEFKPL